MTIIKPVSQISATQWVAAGAGTNHAAIDEGVPDNGDTDYTRNRASSNSLIVALASASDPGLDTGHVVRVVAKSTAAKVPPYQLVVQVRVDAGATVVASFTIELSAVYATYTYTLTASEAANLAGKYGGISLRFTTDTDGNTAIHTRVTLAQMELPDATETPVRTTAVRAEVSARYIEEEEVTPLPLPDVVPVYPLHNWKRTGVFLETSYLTDITETPGNGAEERLSLRDRPLRTVGANWTGMTRTLSNRLGMAVMRMLHQRSPMPLYCDQGELTAAYVSGTSLYLDTRYRRFYKGGRVLVGDPVGSVLENAEIASIASVEDDRLILSSGLSSGHPSSAFVFPLLDTEAKLSGSLEAVTDFNSISGVSYTEVHGKSALPPSSEDTLDNIVTVYNGIPVFRFPPDWNANIRLAPNRPGASLTLGRAPYVVLEGARPRFSYNCSFQFEREAFWEFLQFFDSRRGRAYPFMFVSPETVYEVVDLQAGYVDVAPEGNIEDHQTFVTYLAFEDSSGDYYIREIASIVDNTTYWRITFSSAFVSVPSDVRRLTLAHLVRLANDSMRENWQTTEVCYVSLEFTDLPTEVDVEIANILDPVVYGAKMNLASLFLWASSAKNVSKATTDVFPAYERLRLIKGEELELAAFIDDSRVNANRVYALGLSFPEPFLAHFDPAQTANPAYLTLFDNWKYNQGRSSCEAPLGTAEWDVVFQAISSKWWDDSKGFTLFWCGRLTKKGGTNDDHVLIWDGDKAFPTVSTSGFAFATNFVRLGPLSFAITSIASKADRFYVLRWDPGVSARVYRSGVLKHEVLVSVPLSITKATTNYTKVHTGVAPDSDVGLNQDKKIGDNGFFNTVLLYNAALSDVEMNLVGNYLASMYPSFWEDL